MVLLVLLAAIAVTAACGGGGTNGGNGQTRTQLTDPASVPSSTPISGELRYLIRDNGISAPDGLTTAVPDTGGVSGGAAGSTYTVEPGDTCSAIAARLDVPLADLLKANPLIDSGCTNLRPGQALKIPGSSGNGGGGGAAATPTPPSGGGSGTEHIVEEGDLCVDIAAAYGVDLEEMIALNDLDCGNLQIGQVIRIP